MTRPAGEPGPPTGVSRTAVVIAQAREAESARPDRLFDDPLAGPLADAAGRITGISEAGRRAGEHFVLRTRFFDDRLREAVAAGPRQVVLLAAGLDTRAFRLDWPEGTRLFEVDLPDLISFKEKALADRGARPACDRTVVPADLREDWASPLLAAGLDPDEPIAWLIEGVLMYLTPQDGARVLGRVSELSPPGSRLAVEHVNRAYAELPQMRPRHEQAHLHPGRLAVRRGGPAGVARRVRLARLGDPPGRPRPGAGPSPSPRWRTRGWSAGPGSGSSTPCATTAATRGRRAGPPPTPAGTSTTPTRLPKTSTRASATPARTPKTSTRTSETPTRLPKTPTRTSETPRRTSVTPARTPESPERPTDDRKRRRCHSPTRTCANC
ncbi:SAM-dependent methyltransferase [Streptosporangium vulgare]|uniref:SAM-dependent methyltransferase n=1 Tax=Streptosporangium vulgare TaxID=46190 RepID=UPI0031D1A1A3